MAALPAPVPPGAAQLAAVAEKAQAIKDKLMEAVDEDTAAFQAYLDALRLPSDTPEQKQVRSAKMQQGLVPRWRSPIGPRC